MQLLHAVPDRPSLLQSTLFFELFRQQMHTAAHVCIVYAGYALSVYDDESKNVIPADISTLSTWLSTVLHGKRRYKPPFFVSDCGKPCPIAAFSTCGVVHIYFLPGYYKACRPIVQTVTIPLEKQQNCRENVSFFSLKYDFSFLTLFAGHAPRVRGFIPEPVVFKWHDHLNTKHRPSEAQDGAVGHRRKVQPRKRTPKCKCT